MSERIIFLPQLCGFAACRKSAMARALAFQRVLAAVNAALSPALAACRISTAIVMWLFSSVVSAFPAALP